MHLDTTNKFPKSINEKGLLDFRLSPHFK